MWEKSAEQQISLNPKVAYRQIAKWIEQHSSPAVLMQELRNLYPDKKSLSDSELRVLSEHMSVGSFRDEDPYIVKSICRLLERKEQIKILSFGSGSTITTDSKSCENSDFGSPWLERGIQQYFGERVSIQTVDVLPGSIESENTPLFLCTNEQSGTIMEGYVKWNESEPEKLYGTKNYDQVRLLPMIVASLEMQLYQLKSHSEISVSGFLNDTQEKFDLIFCRNYPVSGQTLFRQQNFCFSLIDALSSQGDLVFGYDTYDDEGMGRNVEIFRLDDSGVITHTAFPLETNLPADYHQDHWANGYKPAQSEAPKHTAVSQQPDLKTLLNHYPVYKKSKNPDLFFL